MDVSREHHLEWGNPVTKENSWYAPTEKWILVPKSSARNNSQKLWSSKRRKARMWVPQSFLDGRTKHSWEEIMGQIEEQGLEKRSSRDCLTWGSIPYAATKPSHYCWCQEVLANRSLIWMPPERLCQSLRSTESDAHSQPFYWEGGPQ